MSEQRLVAGLGFFNRRLVGRKPAQQGARPGSKLANSLPQAQDKPVQRMSTRCTRLQTSTGVTNGGHGNHSRRGVNDDQVPSFLGPCNLLQERKCIRPHCRSKQSRSRVKGSVTAAAHGHAKLANSSKQGMKFADDFDCTAPHRSRIAQPTCCTDTMLLVLGHHLDHRCKERSSELGVAAPLTRRSPAPDSCKLSFKPLSAQFAVAYCRALSAMSTVVTLAAFDLRHCEMFLGSVSRTPRRVAHMLVKRVQGCFSDMPA